MRRFPAVLILIACLTLAACASQNNADILAYRIALLELEMGLTQGGVDLNRESIRSLDSRLTFLENEAIRRGVSLPPRTAQSYGQGTIPETPPAPVYIPPSQQPPPLSSTSNLPSSPVSTASPQAQSQSSGSVPNPATVASSNIPSPMYEAAEMNGPQSVYYPTPVQQPTQVASTISSNNSSGSQYAYDTALQLYRTGRFAESETAFNAFLATYPSNRLVPNALYWRGETYYARAMYVDAIFSFKDVQTRFPDNQKTPDSLLKTAMAYQKLGDAGNASLHLSALYEDWPNSEAARRASSLNLRP